MANPIKIPDSIILLNGYRMSICKYHIYSAKEFIYNNREMIRLSTSKTLPNDIVLYKEELEKLRQNHFLRNGGLFYVEPEYIFMLPKIIKEHRAVRMYNIIRAEHQGIYENYDITYLKDNLIKNTNKLLNSIKNNEI